MLCLVPFFLAGLALAQQPQPKEQAPAASQPKKPTLSQGACKAEVEKFCKDRKKGDVGECLMQYEAYLSKACTAVVKERSERKHVESLEKARAACKGEIEKFCQDKDKAKIDECLDANKEDVSAACKTALDMVQAYAEDMRHEGCGADIDKFCTNVDLGDSTQCLKQHKNKLSASCKATLEKVRGNKSGETEQKKTEKK
jgi:hypothetical protein